MSLAASFYGSFWLVMGGGILYWARETSRVSFAFLQQGLKEKVMRNKIFILPQSELRCPADLINPNYSGVLWTWTMLSSFFL